MKSLQIVRLIVYWITILIWNEASKNKNTEGSMKIYKCLKAISLNYSTSIK